MTSKHNTKRSDEDISILLSLAAATGGHVGPCPDAAMIAAWHDNTLVAEDESALKKHLRLCSTCYGDWLALLEVAALLPAQEQAPATPGLAERIRSFLRTPAIRWQPLGAVTAAVATVAIVWQLVTPPRGADWRRSVDRSYSAFFEMTTEAARDALIDPGRWTWQPGLGSRSLTATEDGLGSAHGAARYAFAAGVRTSLDTIAPASPDWLRILRELPREPMCDSAPQIANCEQLQFLFGELGRWSVLMHYACSELPVASDDGPAPALEAPSFWLEQQTLLASFRSGATNFVQGDPFELFLSQWQASVSERNDAHSAAAALCARSAALLSLGLN